MKLFHLPDWLSLLINAAAAAGTAWGVFMWLGKRSLEQFFQRDLEEFKHEQNKEIEAMRQRIQATFSRISKVHEREFEILPKAWFLLHDAIGRASTLVPMLREVPELQKMSAADFSDFLRTTPLSERARSEIEIADPSERVKKYLAALDWFQVHDAIRAQIEFHNYVIENRIFMTPELSEQFTAIDNVLSEALRDNKHWQQFRGYGGAQIETLRKSSAEKVNGLNERIHQIERAVQARLRVGEA